MTLKQIERIKSKIATIRRTLATEKRLYGFYDDSRGLRYLPLSYYIKLGDYKGGLTYCRWFYRNFEDDMADAGFLFEWTIILFKNGKMKESRQKAFETYCSGNGLFDLFFTKIEDSPTDIKVSKVKRKTLAPHFPYNAVQPELQDFAQWLAEFMKSDMFLERSRKYRDTMLRLRTESDEETRGYLLSHTRQLQNWE